jgi:hypothetical protein
VKVGWSWFLFFLSGVFGIPLFMRKLTLWGFVFLAFNVIGLAGLIAGDNPAAQLMTILVQLLGFGLTIFMGAKGNEITAKNYLSLGWRFVEPESDMTKYAKMRWQMFDQPSPQTREAAPGERTVRW